MAALVVACGGGDSGDSSQTEASAQNPPAAPVAQPENQAEAAAPVEETAAVENDAPAMPVNDVSEAADEMADAAGEVAENVETAMADAADAADGMIEQGTATMSDAVAAVEGEVEAVQASLAAGGDAAAGRRVFLQCMACHAVDPGVNKVGPSLHGIVGREAGTVEGFNYTDANANSGIVWTKDILFEYLEDPQSYIEGTRMVFPGLKSEEDRRNVIAYLAEQN
ncbi:MAG: cytochrome c family protein [Pseudomonadota bacterium]